MKVYEQNRINGANNNKEKFIRMERGNELFVFISSKNSEHIDIKQYECRACVCARARPDYIAGFNNRHNWPIFLQYDRKCTPSEVTQLWYILILHFKKYQNEDLLKILS
jgi:hypothetical protein